MDEFDRVIRDIQKKTADDILRWKVLPPSKLPELEVYAPRIKSAYRADYWLGEEGFVLIFIGRWEDTFDSFSNNMTEEIVFELLVLGGEGEVVLRLYSGVVETKDLYRLASLIGGHNDQIKGFFEAFERANAAETASG